MNQSKSEIIVTMIICATLVFFHIRGWWLSRKEDKAAFAKLEDNKNE